MAYAKSVLQRAAARLEQARLQNEHECDQRIAAIYQKVPRLAVIDRELRRTSAKIYAAAFRASEPVETAMARLKEENLALQREREWLLDSEGIAPEDLERTPVCQLCGGSGYQGAAMCECLRELCRQEQKKELALAFGAGWSSFDKFRLDVYPRQYEPKLGASPHVVMQHVYQNACNYAKSFSLESPSLLFMGATGLGKTLLSGCIARVVADRGFSVCYAPAGKLFSDFETEKFRLKEDGALTADYLESELLIVDDLGTEMTTQFSISALYQIVNGRLRAGKPTVVSTNLPDGELELRYSAQIASRLLGAYELYQFCGKDVRMVIKAEQSGRPS